MPFWKRIECGHGDQKLNSLDNDKKQPKDASNSVLKNEPKKEPEIDTKQQLPNKVITDSDSKVDPNQVSVQIVAFDSLKNSIFEIRKLLAMIRYFFIIEYYL